MGGGAPDSLMANVTCRARAGAPPGAPQALRALPLAWALGTCSWASLPACLDLESQDLGQGPWPPPPTPGGPAAPRVSHLVLAAPGLLCPQASHPRPWGQVLSAQRGSACPGHTAPSGDPHTLPLGLLSTFLGSSLVLSAFGPLRLDPAAPRPAHTRVQSLPPPGREAQDPIPPPEAGATTALQTSPWPLVISPHAPHFPRPPGSHPAALPPAGPHSAVAPVRLCAHLVSWKPAPSRCATREPRWAVTSPALRQPQDVCAFQELGLALCCPSSQRTPLPASCPVGGASGSGVREGAWPPASCPLGPEKLSPGQCGQWLSPAS